MCRLSVEEIEEMLQTEAEDAYDPDDAVSGRIPGEVNMYILPVTHTEYTLLLPWILSYNYVVSVQVVLV